MDSAVKIPREELRRNNRRDIVEGPQLRRSFRIDQAGSREKIARLLFFMRLYFPLVVVSFALAAKFYWNSIDTQRNFPITQTPGLSLIVSYPCPDLVHS